MIMMKAAWHRARGLFFIIPDAETIRNAALNSPAEALVGAGFKPAPTHPSLRGSGSHKISVFTQVGIIKEGKQGRSKMRPLRTCSIFCVVKNLSFGAADVEGRKGE